MAETKTSAAATDAKETKAAPKVAKPAAKTAAAKKLSKDDAMKKHQQMVQFVQNVLSEMESDIKRMHMILGQLAKFDPENVESLESVNKELDGMNG